MSHPIGPTDALDDAPARFEFTFLAVGIALVLMLAMAGIPATEEPVAGEGSDALRQGWLEQHEAAAAEGAEQGRGLDELVVPEPR
jgi:hypothetical protein